MSIYNNDSVMDMFEKMSVSDSFSSSQPEDVSLLSRCRSGDTDAEEELISKYSRLVRVCARPLFLVGGDSEDLIQEGMIGLLNAITHYDASRDATFRTFAELCIRNRLYSAIKSAARSKHHPLNDYVSFESPQFDESTLVRFCFLRDPEDLFIAREQYNEMSTHFYDSLSGFESQVLELYLSGLSYSEIAVKVNKSSKSVDNAVQRIRKKLTQSLNLGEVQ